MANNQSWEFYQQPGTGTKYPLQWVAGFAVPDDLSTPISAEPKVTLPGWDDICCFSAVFRVSGRRAG